MNNREKIKKIRDKLLNKNTDLILDTILKSKVGPKGDKGNIPVIDVDYPAPKDGKTPVKGKDYFDENEIKDFKVSVTPKSGVDYFTKEEIKDFKDSVTPIKGKDYKDGDKGEKGDSVKGEKGDIGKTGKDADQDKITSNTIDVIVKKFNDYKEKILEEIGIKFTKREKVVLEKLEMKLAMMVQSLQVHGGGLGRNDILELIAGNSTNRFKADLTSQCDGANMVFTLPEDYTSGSVLLWSTYYPIVYRPIVDFTETGSNQITLVAAEVGPPETGHTLVAIYDKA